MKQKPVLPLIAVSMLLWGCFSARTVAGEPVRIMPLGDSITKGAGTSPSNGYRKPLHLNLTNNGYNVDFVGGETDGDFADNQHEGHGGWHAEEDGAVDDINDHVYGWLVDNPADIVLLHIGTNDIDGLDEDANEVSNILDEIDRYSENITVILALIINRQSYSEATTQFNNDVNIMALNRIANGDDIIIVDMESKLDYPNDMWDNLHPNDTGYAKMADVWYEVLSNLLGIAPVIISTPVTDANIGQLYTYDVDANGYPAPTYTLTTYPPDMAIDHNTGLIEWIPAATGDFDVTVNAGNGGQRPDANQTFTITVTAAIQFDANSSGFDNTDDTTFSWSHTIGSGYDRILVVGIAGEDDDPCNLAISSVEYNDISMNLVEGSSETIGTSDRIKTELYYLLDGNLPSSGSYIVEVSYAGNVRNKCGGAVSLANVNQQPAEVVDTNSNTGSNTISTDITTLTPCAWVVDVVGCGTPGSFTTDEDDQLEQFDISCDNSTAAGSTRLVEPAGPATMSWTHSGANRLAHSVAAFAPTPHTIYGHIIEPNESPIDGALISADPNGGSDTTDPNGYYELIVPYGWSGIVTPAKAECIFEPAERAYSDVIADRSGQDFQDISIYDLDWSGFIGWGDVAVISQHWLESGPEGDVNDDTMVDFLDFAEFALFW